MKVPSRLIYIYDEADAVLLQSLDKHLSALKSEGMIESWHRQLIAPGEVAEDQAAVQLSKADLVVLLVSADLLASNEYLAAIAEAQSRPASRSLRLLPILVRAVDWRSSEIGKLSPLPPDGRPITSYANHDEAWETVALAIRRIISKSHDGPELKQRIPLVSQQPRWILRMTLVLLSALVFGGIATLWPPLKISPFPHHQAGVIVATPWLAGIFGSTPGDGVCHELEQLGPGRAQCVRVSVGLDLLKLKKKAQDAGAVLLVAADITAQASLHLLAEDRKLLLPLDPPLNFPMSTPGLANLLYSLREVISESNRPCKVNLAEALHGGSEFALLATLTEWHCQKGRPITGDGTLAAYTALLAELDAQLCRDSSAKEPRCALARYLAALDCPATSGMACKSSISKLSELARDASSSQLRWMAGLEVSRRTCRAAPDDSAEAILRLSKETNNPCALVRLSQIQDLTPIPVCDLPAR